MFPKRHAFFRSLVNSSLDSEIGVTSYCFLTRLSLFEGNPLRVQADAAPCACEWVWYIPLCSARDCVPRKWKLHVFARSRFIHWLRWSSTGLPYIILVNYISKRPLGIRSHSRNSSRLQVGTTIHHVKTEFRFVFEGDQKDSMKTGHTFEREKD